MTTVKKLHHLSESQKLVMQRRGETFISRAARRDNLYDLGGGRIFIPGHVNGHAQTVSSIANPAPKGDPWTDCSGGAFKTGLVMGLPLHDIFGDGPIWTGTFASLLREGESDFLTFFLKEPDQTEGHVIMRLRERPKPWHSGVPRYRFAEVGGSDNEKAGGMCWLHTPGKRMGLTVHDRLSEFDYHRCVPGF
jgi:hypothetical protein